MSRAGEVAHTLNLSLAREYVRLENHEILRWRSLNLIRAIKYNQTKASAEVFRSVCTVQDTSTSIWARLPAKVANPRYTAFVHSTEESEREVEREREREKERGVNTFVLQRPVQIIQKDVHRTIVSIHECGNFTT